MNTKEHDLKIGAYRQSFCPIEHFRLDVSILYPILLYLLISDLGPCHVKHIYHKLLNALASNDSLNYYLNHIRETRFISYNKLIASKTVFRYKSNSISSIFANPSSLLNSYKNCGNWRKISFRPTTSIVTVSNCLCQSSSFSRIGINFQS